MDAIRQLLAPTPRRYRIHRARVPAVAAPTGAAPVDDEGCVLMDIRVEGDRIDRMDAVSPGDGHPAGDGSMPTIDVGGRQVWPTLVDVHTHLDKGQSIPRVRPDGSIHTGAIETHKDYGRWNEEEMYARMDFGIRCAYHHGVSAIRTHLDSFPAIAGRSWKVFAQLKAHWADRMDLQAVAIIPLSDFEGAWGPQLADLVAGHEGILGGVTDALGDYDGGVDDRLRRLLDRLIALAKSRSMDLDLHVDQLQDVQAFSLPIVARCLLESGYAGTALADHCVNLSLQPDEVLAQTLVACKQARIGFVTLPTPMMYLQDRVENRTPRWRGVTAVSELRSAGLPVAVAGDNCRDAWFPFGDHDMVDTAQQAVRILQLDNPISQIVEMTSVAPAAMAGFHGHGRLAAGQRANFIIFNARSMNEWMCRPQSDRIVVRNGQWTRSTIPQYEELDRWLATPA